MQSLIETYSALPPLAAYFLIFLGIAIEGDLVLFSATFLAYQGILNIYVIGVITMLGVFIRDTIWFWIGRRKKEELGVIGRWALDLADPFDDHLTDRTFYTLFVAKFVYGLHLAIIVRAGTLDIPFKRFMRSDMLAAFAWMLAIAGLGYASSASFELARSYLRYVEIALAIGIVAFLFFHRYISRYSKKKLRS